MKEDFIKNLEYEMVSEAIKNSMNSAGLGDYSFCDEVCDMFVDHTVGMGYEKIGDFFDDLTRGGCASGIIGELIYYSDIKDFYIRHMDDIEDYIVDLEDEFGDRIRLDSPRYNSAAWLVVDMCGSSIEEIVPEKFEKVISDTLETLDKKEVISLAKDSSFEEVKTLATDYFEQHFGEDLEEAISEEEKVKTKKGLKL